VLINVPALNTYADGIALGRLADGVVLIVGSEFHSARIRQQGRRELTCSTDKNSRCGSEPAHLSDAGASIPLEGIQQFTALCD
jgi:hypothetical protein